MKNTLTTAYLCAEILTNHIDGLNILNISISDYAQVTPRGLVPDNLTSAKYLISIEFEARTDAAFSKGLYKAKQAIHKVIGLEAEPIRGTEKFHNFRNTHTFVYITS